MLDWLIIGGGIHGTYLSLYLTQRKRIPADRLRVLDPFPEPLALWRRFSTNSGMVYLRSSHAHNLHYDPFSLVTFARTHSGAALAQFIEPYGRPSLALFQAHCDWLIEQYHLDRLRLTGRALALRQINDGWQIETQNGSIEARRLILAFGITEQPAWPVWARDLPGVVHLFEPTFDRERWSATLKAEAAYQPSIVVIGGGITAGQSALALALDFPGQVTLLLRHPLRLHQFDADLGWITFQNLDRFHAEPDYSQRRRMIQAARHRGSMPSDVAAELQKAEAHGLLRLQTGEVSAASVAPDGRGLDLRLTSGEPMHVSQVMLATGFEGRRPPGGEWLGAAAAAYGLPTAPDGYPIVDSTLCWGRGLYVSGPLAELEVGPVARNFAGVKLAAERIGASL